MRPDEGQLRDRARYDRQQLLARATDRLVLQKHDRLPASLERQRPAGRVVDHRLRNVCVRRCRAGRVECASPDEREDDPSSRQVDRLARQPVLYTAVPFWGQAPARP